MTLNASIKRAFVAFLRVEGVNGGFGAIHAGEPCRALAGC